MAVSEEHTQTAKTAIGRVIKSYPYISGSFLLMYLPIFFGFFGNTLITYIGFLLLTVSGFVLYRQQKLSGLLTALTSFISFSLYRKAYLLFVLLWLVNTVLFFFTMEYKAWDTGIIQNPLVSYFYTGTFYNYFLDKHGIADHFYPFYILFTPLFNIYNSFIWLILFRLISYLLCPYLLYKTGQKLLPYNSKLVYVGPIMWMFHEYTANTQFFDFQPSTPATAFIIGAFYLLITGRYLWALLPLILILFFKENLALVWLCAGAYIFLYRKKYILGSVLFIAGIAAGILITSVVMPAYSAGSTFGHTGRFAVFSHIPEKLQMLFLAFASVGFIPLLSPRSVLFILPAFALNLVTNFTNMFGFHYHYMDMPFAVMFIGVLYGLKAFAENDTPLNRFSRLSIDKKNTVYAVALWFFISQNTLLPTHGIRRTIGNLGDIPYFMEIEQLKKKLNREDEVYTMSSPVPYFAYMPYLHELKQLENRTVQGYGYKDKHFYVITAKDGRFDYKNADRNRVTDKCWTA
ncbi:hypothetical protein CHS0354_026810 [Potamilus streckersoni]|uniref:DUF2079 domain-containing protein n=1 Tax=Potamilus streckersoni TaxID=2493646 RepID=A0AAE0T594_9BIVA|nr:hypothetical protein CHS0354_026810 [Potamilus streckersoni]